MSETKPTDTRPWGSAPVASGVEAVYLWATDEIKALHARFDGAATTAEASAKTELAALREKFSAELSAAHQRIDDLKKQMNMPAPPPAIPARVQTMENPVQEASTSESAAAEIPQDKGAPS